MDYIRPYDIVYLDDAYFTDFPDINYNWPLALSIIEELLRSIHNLNVLVVGKALP